MVVGRSYATLSAPTLSRPGREALLPLLRWLIIGAAALALGILALSRAGAVGAAAPANCIPINYTTCISNGIYYTNGNPTASITPVYAPSYSYVAPSYVAPTYVAPNTTSTGYPANTVVSTYVDPRYCGGVVSVVTDSSGNLIDVCPGTGQRIYPVFPDYGYGYGGYASPYYSGIYNNSYNTGYYNNYYNNSYANNYNGGYFGTPYNYCDPSAWWCLNYQATGNAFAGVYGPPSTATTTTTTAVTPPATYRVSEVTQPATTTAQAAPAQVTAPAPAAPVATALNASLQPQAAPDASAGGAGVKILSVQQPSAPVATNDGREDGK